MGGEGVTDTLGSIANAIFLLVSIYIYVSLLRQIRRRDPPAGDERQFGLPEAVTALALATLFCILSLGSGSAEIVRLRTRDLIANAIVAIALVAFVAAFLKLRRFNISEMAGLGRLNFGRAVAIGFVLILAAYPLIIFADWITTHVLGTGSSRQGIIDLFSASRLMEQRVIIIVLAVAIAP